MTQIRKRRPLSPKQAAASAGPIDQLLDPAWFKALCDPTRVKILGCLVKCARPCSVGAIAECCAVDLSVVSRHLQLLARAGFLGVMKQGRTVFYRVKSDEFCGALRALADAIELCCPPEKSNSTRGKGDCCDPK